MKKIITVILIISWGYFLGGLKVREFLIENLSPYIQFNKELNQKINNFYQDYSEISRLREENYDLKNKEFIYVNKDFKERYSLVDIGELEKIKKSVENDEFFKGRLLEISNIIYLDKANSKIFVKKVGDFRVGDTVLIGRFFVGNIVSVNNSSYEVDLWNKKERTINSYIIINKSEKLVMNISSENFNTSYIENILSTEDVKIGDLIVTSSTNQNIPKDLFIGVVDRVEGISSQTFRKALIKKGYDLEKSSYVILMKND